MRHKDIWMALGALVLSAAAVETGLGTFLIWLTGHPEPDRVMPLVGGMDVKVKLNLIRIYSAQQFPKEKKLIKEICKKIQDAFEERNFIIHNLSGPTDDPRVLQIQPLKFNSSGELPKPVLYTPEKIMAAAKAISTPYRALEKVFNALGVKQSEK